MWSASFKASIMEESQCFTFHISKMGIMSLPYLPNQRCRKMRYYIDQWTQLSEQEYLVRAGYQQKLIPTGVIPSCSYFCTEEQHSLSLHMHLHLPFDIFSPWFKKCHWTPVLWPWANHPILTYPWAKWSLHWGLHLAYKIRLLAFLKNLENQATLSLHFCMAKSGWSWVVSCFLKRVVYSPVCPLLWQVLFMCAAAWPLLYLRDWIVSW